MAPALEHSNQSNTEEKNGSHTKSFDPHIASQCEIVFPHAVNRKEACHASA